MKHKPSTAAWLTPAAAFFLSAGLWVLALALFGFYPFGQYTVLITDMGQQYVEFHTALYDIVHSGGSLFYTWNTGMGMNFVGLSAYYLASPFTLLLLLFPRAAISEALLLIISLKIACAGLTFSIFLRRAVPVGGTVNVLFSALYALSGFTAVYFFNIMWLDAVVLLPLVILAMLHVIHTQKIAPLTAVLVVLFLANFYTAYMVGLYSLLLLLVLLWLRRHSLPESLHILAVFLRAAILAACFAAFLLVPTYFALKGCQGSGADDPIFLGLNTDPLTLFSKFTWGAYDSVTDSGSGNIYCGVLTFLLIPVWLLNTKISRREKIAGLALISFLLVSMLFCPLDVLWHACETPVWFPCRYSFALVFTLLTCTARAVSLPQGISPRRILSGFIYAVIIIIAINIPEWIDPRKFQTMTGNLAVTLIVLAVYTLLLLVFIQKKKWLRRAALFLIALCVSVELTGNTFTVFKKLDKELHFETQEDFSEYRNREEELTAALDTYTVAESDPLSSSNFYRVENFDACNPNDGLMGGYPSISHYSSFSQRGTFSFLKNCGMVCTSSNKIFRYGKSASALDAILGIRYLYSPEENRAGYVSAGSRTDGLTLYQNTYTLPLAFFADQKIQELPSSGDSPFSLLNTLMSSFDGNTYPYYTSLPVSVSCEEGRIEESDGKTVISADTSATLRFTIRNPKFQDVLLYCNNNFPENIPIFANGTVINPNGERIIRGVIDLGEQPAGEIEISVEVGSKHWFSGLKAAAFDESAFKNLTDSLRSNASQCLTVTTEGSGVPLVTGKISAPRNGTLFTSIPADCGWTAVLDGKKVNTVSAGGAFLTIPVTQGNHTFTLRFKPRGLTEGYILSGLTVLLCIGWFIFRHVHHRKEERK